MMTLPDVSKKKFQVRATSRNWNAAGFSFKDTLYVVVVDQWYSTDNIFIQTDKPIIIQTWTTTCR